MLGYFDLLQDRNRGEETDSHARVIYRLSTDFFKHQVAKVIMRVVAEVTGRPSLLERKEL